MASAVVAHAGARNVVVTDVNPFRLDLAKRMGATRAVDIRVEDLREVQSELGMTEGFDVALEMSGSRSAMEDILQNTIHGANIAILGIPSDPFPIDWSVVIFNMLNLKGIYGREMFETWYKMNVLIESGVDISPVITHRFEVEDYDDAFAATASQESAKVLIRWADRA
jgi:threonine 3-dehydrogenase